MKLKLLDVRAFPVVETFPALSDKEKATLNYVWEVDVEGEAGFCFWPHMERATVIRRVRIQTNSDGETEARTFWINLESGEQLSTANQVRFNHLFAHYLAREKAVA